MEIRAGDSFMTGYGAPNTGDTTKCFTAWSYDCFMRKIPAGTQANPTIIRGQGYDSGCSNPPEIWGTERLTQIFLLNSWVELNCLELTDHSDCATSGAGSTNKCQRTGYPKGEHADRALGGKNISNVVLKQLDIHGFSLEGVKAGGFTNLTVQDTTIRANGSAGWDFDDVDHPSNSGDILFDNVTIEYSGCHEAYPRANNVTDIANCCSQGQGCYSDGLGTPTTGGVWRIEDSDFSRNGQDGLDLLYILPTGSLTVLRSTFENNSGNQLKASTSVHIEDTVLGGKCDYLSTNDLVCNTGDGCSSNWDGDCRAGGDTLAISYLSAGQTVDLVNNTFLGNGASLILTVSNNGDVCDNTETLDLRNNIFVGSLKANQSGNVNFHTDQGVGNCAISADFGSNASNILYNLDNICPNDGVLCPYDDPDFTGVTITTSPTRSFTCANVHACDVTLTSPSPAIDAGEVVAGADVLDNTGADRGATWDIGAFEFSTSSSTCDDQCSLCSTQGTCEASAAFDCNGTGFCCWHTATSSCMNTPEATCDADHCDQCSTQSACEAVSPSGTCVWGGSSCSQAAEEVFSYIGSGTLQGMTLY